MMLAILCSGQARQGPEATELFARQDRMNAIALIALKRPYTFAVLAIAILILGGRAAGRLKSAGLSSSDAHSARSILKFIFHLLTSKHFT